MTEPAQLPVGAKMVAWVLVVGGALYAVVGTIAVFNETRSQALMGMLILAFGVGYLVVGRGMLRGSRPAYLVAIALLGVSVVLAAVRAIAEGDWSLTGQGFVPAVGLWVLLSSEPRAYFARKQSSPSAG